MVGVCEKCKTGGATPGRLFTAAPESVVIAGRWEYPAGWVVRVQVRRCDECWAHAHDAHYSSLNSDELLDVITAELARALGVR